MPGGEPNRKRPGGPGGPGSPASREIPDKLYFRIGEVARLCEVPAYVLRFWEGEFPQLKPNKGGTGQRLYRRRDVEMALRIKNLLYDEGYTIAGARQAFKSELRAGRESTTGEPGGEPGIAASHLEAIQSELREIYTLLSRPAAAPGPTPKQPAPVQSIRPPRPAPAPRVLPPPTPFPGPRRLSLFDDLDEH